MLCLSRLFRFVSVPFHGLPFHRLALYFISASQRFNAFPVQFNTFPSHSFAFQSNSSSKLFSSYPPRCLSQLRRCDSPSISARSEHICAMQIPCASVYAIPRLSSASFRFSAADPITTVLYLCYPPLCFAFATNSLAILMPCVSMLFLCSAVDAIPMLCQAKQVWSTQCQSNASLAMQFRRTPCLTYANP